MKWARDTETGRVLTLPQLYRLREDEIAAVFQLPKALKKIRQILNRNMRCVDCQNPVHVYGSNRLGGFVLAGRRLTREAETFLERVGYSHYRPKNPRNDGIKPVTDCALYFPVDPRIQDMLRKKSRDPRVKDMIRTALCLRENQCLNRPLLWGLFRAAAQRYPTPRERLSFIALTGEELMRHEVFAAHPYILPYFLVRFIPSFRRKGKYGPYDVRFEEHGQQELLYKDIEGTDRVAVVPEYLTMKYKNKPGQRWKDMSWDTRQFPLTETAAIALAERELVRCGAAVPDFMGRAERKPQTRVISIPTGTPAIQVVKSIKSLPQILPGLVRGLDTLRT